jgi:hypothetical protein
MVHVRLFVALIMALVAAAPSPAQSPLLPIVNYQGRLTEGGVPVNGTADITARLWDALVGGNPVSAPSDYLGVPVNDGLFSINLTFGGDVFNGDSRWLELIVNGVTLSPRQLITASPYALQTRGMFYNENQDFLGIGREDRVTTSEVFGIYRPGTSFGGMYVQTDQNGLPFYGYSAGVAGGPDAYHYFDDTEDEWRLNVKGVEGIVVNEFGQVAIGGHDNPQWPLHVVSNNGFAILATNTGANNSAVAGFADGTNSRGINGIANAPSSKAVRGLANDPTAWAGYFQGKVHIEGGNVHIEDRLGIGTDNPGYKLVIREDTNAFAARVENTAFFQTALAGVSTDNGDGVYAQSEGSVGIALKANAFNGARAGEFNGDVDLNGFVHVQDSVSASASPTNHAMLVENTNTGTSTDMFALKTNSSDLTPGSAINFITFFNDNNSSLGSIQGDGAGGVEFAGPGNDYAEWLAHAREGETFAPGDVVGVIAGRISKITHEADQVMVISTQPIVVGNRPEEDDEGLPGWEKVAFIGQAPVRVRGEVHSGDFLIPSGLHDGTAIAVNPSSIAPEQLKHVFATVWESARGDGVHKVNAAIGIDQSAAAAQAIAALQSRQQQQQAELEAMHSRIERLEAAIMQDALRGQVSP